MDENKNTPQDMLPEDELDQLLARFLAEEDDLPESLQEAPVEVADDAPKAAPEEEAVENTAATQEPPVEENPAAETSVQEAAEEAAPAENDISLPEQPGTPEPELSPDSLWENIDAEDPVTVLDSTAGETAAPEIGPDEDALAAIGIALSGDDELESIMEEVNHPDWATEPTAVIPDLKHTASRPEHINAVADAEDEDVMVFTPSEGANHAEDPLSDPALRSLLFDETASFKDDEFRDTFGEVEEIYSSAPAEEEPNPKPEEAPAEPAPPVQEAPPVRKKRPKNKNAYGLLSIPHILTTVVWLVLVVAIGASLGRMLWLCAADVLAFGRPDQTVYITITKTDTLDTVAEKLHRAGLINYPGLFKLYGNLSNIMDDLSIGTYELNTMYDYHALSTSMSEKPAMRTTIPVTIPEGYTCAQIFALLEEKEVCSVAELEEYASTSLFADYWFLEGTERGSKYCLEGFLFPDTYEFYVDSDAKEVYIKLLAAFDYRFTDTMKEKLAALNETLSAKMKKNGMDQAYIDAHQVTIREVVIIASLIEKETSGIEDDSYNISSVIYNRLTNPGKFPYLNIDAALIYVTGDNVLTDEDMAFDSPYNTYLYPGLIPGPISNPGRASLDAALDPSDTSYYYYVLDPSTGTHDYSKTYEEHIKKVEKYKESLGK